MTLSTKAVTFFQVLIQWVVITAAIVCLPLFFLWALIVFPVEIGMIVSGHSMSGIDGSNRKLFEATQFLLCPIGGAIGWISLISLAFIYQNYHLKVMPRWVLIGCAIGAVSVLIGPYSPTLAIPPIVLSTALLIEAWLTHLDSSQKIS